MLTFEREPLEHVIAEIARYLPERVIYRAGNKRTTPITATFPIAQPEAALFAPAQAQGLTVRRIGGLTYLVQEQ